MFVVVSMLFGGALREVAHHAHGYGKVYHPRASAAKQLDYRIGLPTSPLDFAPATTSTVHAKPRAAAVDPDPFAANALQLRYLLYQYRWSNVGQRKLREWKLTVCFRLSLQEKKPSIEGMQVSPWFLQRPIRQGSLAARAAGIKSSSVAVKSCMVRGKDAWWWVRKFCGGFRRFVVGPEGLYEERCAWRGWASRWWGRIQQMNDLLIQYCRISGCFSVTRSDPSRRTCYYRHATEIQPDGRWIAQGTHDVTPGTMPIIISGSNARSNGVIRATPRLPRLPQDLFCSTEMEESTWLAVSANWYGCS
jgi:hypothetical protein